MNHVIYRVTRAKEKRKKIPRKNNSNINLADSSNKNYMYTTGLGLNIFKIELV